MNKKKILIAVIVLLVVIITCCLIKIVFNNSHIETASINTLADNDNGRNINTIANVMDMTTNENIENKTNDVENETIEENNADTKESNTTEKTDNKTTTSQKDSSSSTNKTNSKNNDNNVNTNVSNKNNSSSSTKEEQKKEESKPTNTEKTEDTKENEDTETEEKEETNTENEKLANTFFSEYNKQKTQEAVNYINEQMKKDEMYEELGGYAVACTTKPTNYWISYSSNSKLDGIALAGCKVSVYVENYYRYNSRGTDYYLYDTKIYLYQEVI